MLCGCHYKIFANLEWAFQMRKGVKALNLTKRNIVIIYGCMSLLGEIIKNDDVDTIANLNIQIVSLKTYISELELRLKKYTNGENHKRYYEKNKEKIKETGSSYLQKLKIENPEKLKEYSHRAYLNQKLKKETIKKEQQGLAPVIEVDAD